MRNLKREKSQTKRFSTLPRISHLMQFNKKMTVYQCYRDGWWSIMLSWAKHNFYGGGFTPKECEEEILSKMKGLRIKGLSEIK